jgi:hypothetical protein
MASCIAAPFECPYRCRLRIGHVTGRCTSVVPITSPVASTLALPGCSSLHMGLSTRRVGRAGRGNESRGRLYGSMERSAFHPPPRTPSLCLTAPEPCPSIWGHPGWASSVRGYIQPWNGVVVMGRAAVALSVASSARHPTRRAFASRAIRIPRLAAKCSKHERRGRTRQPH